MRNVSPGKWFALQGDPLPNECLGHRLYFYNAALAKVSSKIGGNCSSVGRKGSKKRHPLIVD
jgi:hypothetical protein